MSEGPTRPRIKKDDILRDGKAGDSLFWKIVAMSLLQIRRGKARSTLSWLETTKKEKTFVPCLLQVVFTKRKTKLPFIYSHQPTTVQMRIWGMYFDVQTPWNIEESRTNTYKRNTVRLQWMRSIFYFKINTQSAYEKYSRKSAIQLRYMSTYHKSSRLYEDA